MKIKNSFLFSFFFIGLAACGHQSGSSSASGLDSQINSGKELASLGNVKIYEGYVDLLARVNPNIEGQLKTPAGKKRLVDNLLEQELFYQESLNRKLDALPQVKEKASLYQRVIVGQSLLDEEVAKQSKEYYEKNKEKEFSQVEIAQILIRTNPQPPTPAGKDAKAKTDNTASDAQALKKAQEAKTKLDSGTPWETVVTEYSDDVATKSRGGLLGPINKEDRRSDRLDWKELIEKAFTMKVDEISDIIKAKDGYHIIKLVKAAAFAPFEAVENSIKFRLRSQVKNELLSKLTQGKTTEYTDTELKSPSPSLPQGLPSQMMNTQGMPSPDSPQIIQLKPGPATPPMMAPKTPESSKKPVLGPRGDGSEVIQTPSGPQVIKTKQTKTPQD